MGPRSSATAVEPDPATVPMRREDFDVPPARRGSFSTCTLSSTRPSPKHKHSDYERLLVELGDVVADPSLGFPRRLSVGVHG